MSHRALILVLLAAFVLPLVGCGGNHRGRNHDDAKRYMRDKP